MQDQKTTIIGTKDELIAQLTDNLNILRVKAELTQADIAQIVGISRQTYCQIENGNVKMSWSVYLSLLLLFSSNAKSAELLKLLGINPTEIVNSINEGIQK